MPASIRIGGNAKMRSQRRSKSQLFRSLSLGYDLRDLSNPVAWTLAGFGYSTSSADLRVTAAASDVKSFFGLRK